MRYWLAAIASAVIVFGAWLMLAPFQLGGGQHLVRCGSAVAEWADAGYYVDRKQSRAEQWREKYFGYLREDELESAGASGGGDWTDLIPPAQEQESQPSFDPLPEPERRLVPNRCHKLGTKRAAPGLLALLAGGAMLAGVGIVTRRRSS